MRILIAGWFSYKDMGNSAGDMIARDLVCDWLKNSGIEFDVAVSDLSLYPGGKDIQTENPLNYSDLLFVCGPFGNGRPITELLDRYKHCRLIGVNLTLLEPLETWNPFTILVERDSSRMSNPDLSFLGPPPIIPVVGVIQITKQDEYGKRDLHKEANNKIEEFIKGKEVSVVRIDTVIADNKGGLRTAGEIESLISKMDIVFTTRLHGTVLALKNGVPVIPIDPVEGGAKISEQVKRIGWPVLFSAESVDSFKMDQAFEFCLSLDARRKAEQCRKNAFKTIEEIRNKLLLQLMELK